MHRVTDGELRNAENSRDASAAQGHDAVGRDHEWGCVPMTSSHTTLPAVRTVFALLLAIPVVILGVVMPVVGLLGLGPGVMGQGGMGGGQLWLLLLPLIPVTVLTLAYAAFQRSHERRVDRQGPPSFTVLRNAYARGELSTEEFESRRSRLVGTADTRAETTKTSRD